MNQRQDFYVIITNYTVMSVSNLISYIGAILVSFVILSILVSVVLTIISMVLSILVFLMFIALFASIASVILGYTGEKSGQTQKSHAEKNVRQMNQEEMVENVKQKYMKGDISEKEFEREMELILGGPKEKEFAKSKQFQ